MDIKPRYNQYRVGAMFISPVQATSDDLDEYVMATRVGGSKQRIWKLKVDCRALVGKLMRHEEMSKLIIKNNDDFLLVLDLEHPKRNGRILIGGNETKSIIVYKVQEVETMVKRVEEWLKKILANIEPAENLFKYGRINSYGLIPNDAGQLAYVIIKASPDRREKKIFGQPYTENTWGTTN